MTKLRTLYEVYPAPSRATLPLGIRVNDILYGTITSADPVTGDVEPDVASQVQTAAAVLADFLKRGGMQQANLARIVLSTTSDSASTVRRIWKEEVGQREGTVMQVLERDDLLPAGHHLRLDVVASTGGTADAWRMLGLTRDGLPEGIKVGPLLFAPFVTAADVRSGKIASQETAEQVRLAFDNLERLLQRAGVDQGQLLRIAGFHADLGEKDLMNQEMVRRFPDPARKPVHKYVPAVLPPGIRFALQAIAMDGERRIIEMEGIKHNDPISLGALAGNVFVSSRVQARLEPTAEEQAQRLLQGHARKLMEHIGGGLEDVSQMVWGIGDAEFADAVQATTEKHWPSENRPRLDIVEADFPHSPLPRLEFFGLLKANDSSE